MFCKICEKEIDPEIGEVTAGNCIYQTFRCPKCHTTLKSGFKRTEPLEIEKLEKVEDILKRNP